MAVFPPTVGPRAALREDADRALSAWREAVSRAEALGPARLLYDARVSQGPFSMSGNLAVRETPETVEAALSGPFGNANASYTDGALRGDGLRPILIAPDELRWLRAGIWKGEETPVVAGLDGGDALLRWAGRQQVEGVLDSARARFKSIKVTRPEGGISATFTTGEAARPRRIDLEDLASGNGLRLTLLSSESVP